jgi:hypothetical protein
VSELTVINTVKQVLFFWLKNLNELNLNYSEAARLAALFA